MSIKKVVPGVETIKMLKQMREKRNRKSEDKKMTKEKRSMEEIMKDIDQLNEEIHEISEEGKLDIGFVGMLVYGENGEGFCKSVKSGDTMMLAQGLGQDENMKKVIAYAAFCNMLSEDEEEE